MAPGPNALAVGTVQAAIPQTDPPELYLLPFSKGLYTVPQSAIMSYPKRANVMASGEALGELLASKAPEKWLPFCHPDTLCRIRGEGGSNCVYTTFAIEGHPNEKRFLRFISATVAEKNFKKIKEELKDRPIANERQRIRMEVLNWNKLVDCPNRPQLSPELEKWEALMGTDFIKSAECKPQPKKRPKPGQSAQHETDQMIDEYVADQKFIKKPKNSTTKIIETDGVVHVLFYKNLMDDDDANDI